MSLSLGILVSGGGSNLQAILDAIETKELDAACRVVVSNRPGALALARAEKAGVKAVSLDHKEFPNREAFDTELVRVLQDEGVEWVALAGFMRLLTPVFLNAFEHRVVNIHPSLLPAFQGVNAQKQAFDYGVRVTGCTVHFVDGGVDTGQIIDQTPVPVLEGDSAETLRARILIEEHALFVEALKGIAQGKVQYRAESRGDRHEK